MLKALHRSGSWLLLAGGLVLGLGACAQGHGSGDGECGDGALDRGEQCDGHELNGGTCQALGAGGGILSCTPTCIYDTSGCLGGGTCGNGLVEGAETCDDGNTLVGDGCGAMCQVEPGWSCTGKPSVCTLTCGNGQLDTGESCDGSALGGGTCLALGFTGGTLDCNGVCVYDTASCVFSADCGNGTLDASEACDGADLGGATCTSIGLEGGTLACSTTCTFDTSGCGGADCGNGQVEGGEECDDANQVSGDGCSATCAWESTCTANGTISCGGSVSGDLDSANSSISNYSCGGNALSDEDDIYSFVAPNTGTATVTLDVDSSGLLIPEDFDLVILEGACNPKLCKAMAATSGDDSVSFPVTAGVTYYIVVELYAWGGLLATGEYDVDLTCP